jgi:tRNA threonylcarbamoyladenosine biosynthesis protein TsaB
VLLASGPIIGITTSGNPAVALVREGEEPIRAASDTPRSHAEKLVPLIHQVLDEAGLAPADLAAIAVGTGPGTYTGLRIGLVTARTLAFALDIPVWGISDLDVLAADAALRLHLESGSSILATTDAKRHEVYWGRYRVDPRPLNAADAGPWLTRLEGPSVSAPAVAPDAGTIVGEGALRYPEELAPAAGANHDVDPALLARLAARRAAEGEDVNTEPLYLRRPDVQAPSPRKRATP